MLLLLFLSAAAFIMVFYENFNECPESVRVKDNLNFSTGMEEV